MVSLRPLIARVRCFLSDAVFLLLDRLMLPVGAPRTNNVAVPARMVLWQYVGDLRRLGGSNKEKWLARSKSRTKDHELLCPTASH